MTDFIDPRELGGFANEDDLIAYLVERVVRPRLAETLGPTVDPSQIPGKVVVFGGRNGVRQETITAIQEHLQQGIALDYVLDELTDLQVARQRESTLGALTVHYIELETNRDPDDPLPMSVTELQAIFEAS